MPDISPGDSPIDSRDVIKGLEEAKDDLLYLYSKEHDDIVADDFDDPDFQKWLAEVDNDEKDIYLDFKNLCEECEGYGDWAHGETLIKEDDWVDYVKEMLTDLGYLPKDLPWWIEIDYDKTAENVAQDYMTVTFGDETYYMRTS